MAGDQPGTEEALGRADAQSYFQDPDSFEHIPPRTEPYARAALAELERLQRGLPGVARNVVEGGGISARGLNLDDYHGLREVVQNADDQGASDARFAVRESGGRRQLLIVHNGSPVELTDVIPMTYAFFSTKRKNARKKGRFGVGLKTLSRICADMEVHCWPYSFAVADAVAIGIAAAPAIPGFYSPQLQETLLVLSLRPEFDTMAFTAWFEEWRADDLLFLMTVRSISLHDLQEPRTVLSRQLVEAGPPQELLLSFERGTRPVQQQRFVVDARLYDRFVATLPVPPGLHRADKATGEETEVAVAVPLQGDVEGRLYLGLPSTIRTGGAFAVDGQFDPATTREDLTRGKWNEWLISEAGDLLAAAAAYLAGLGLPHVWNSVPVGCEPTSANPWVQERLQIAWNRAADAFADAARLPIAGSRVSLSDLLFETEEAEDLLSAGDHEKLAPGNALPGEMRDPSGIWRKVLEGLAKSRALGLSDILSGCDGDAFEGKEPAWFLTVAHRLLDTPEEPLLFGHSWVPLAGNGRARPSEPDEATSMICLRDPALALPSEAKLVVVADAALSGEDDLARDVREWLQVNANFVDDPDADDLLRAFARRHGDAPLDVNDRQLVALRDLFERVGSESAAQLGTAVGAAIQLEVFSFGRDPAGRTMRRTGLRARPSEFYLSASIEDEPLGWTKAAADTSGLLWAAPRYADLLAVKRSQRQGSRRDQVRGAKRFLMLLGAEIAPRLVDQSTRVEHPLPHLQQQQSARLGYGAGILHNDHVSPDLESVLLHLAMAERGLGKRKKRRKPSSARRRSEGARGLALFRCLTSSWTRLYAQKCRAHLYRDRKTPVFLNSLPATWLAKLADAAWLEDEDGALRSPIRMIVPTTVTRAIYEPHEIFAIALNESDALEPLARELHMIVDPPASDVLRQIENIKAEGGQPNKGRLLRLYKALAGHCRAASNPYSPVGDVQLTRLRGKFGIAANRSGLLHDVVAPGAKGWVSPAAVFTGRDIFHGRRSFVLPDRELIPLWSKLNIKPPTIGDCVAELRRAAKEPVDALAAAFLIDVYRYLNELVRERGEQPFLHAIPLVCQRQWVTHRPVYVADLRELSDQIKDISLWDPPCAIETLGPFLRSAGIERIPMADAPIVLSDTNFATRDVQEKFTAAVNILRDDLARDDEPSYRSGNWESLGSAALWITGPASLWLAVGESPQQRVSVRAHAELGTPCIYVEDVANLGTVHDGGRAIARFFSPECRRAVGLAWIAAWTQAAAGVCVATLALAEDEEADVDELAKVHDKLTAQPKRRRQSDGGAGEPPGSGVAPPSPKPPPRRLKAFPDEITFTSRVEDADPSMPAPGGRLRKRRPLSDGPPHMGENKRGPAPMSARTDYTQQELQEEAWRYLEIALGSEESPLRDYQAVAGVGADGAIDWRTFVELKAHARNLPNAESLTPAEVQRAFKEGGRYLLAVVTGLEEGFRTEVRIFADPLRTLPWTPNSNVLVSGLNRGRRLVIDIEGKVEVISEEDESSGDAETAR